MLSIFILVQKLQCSFAHENMKKSPQTALYTAGVLGLPEHPWNLGFRKEDRKRDRQCITMSTPEFEKLSTALQKSRTL